MPSIPAAPCRTSIIGHEARGTAMTLTLCALLACAAARAGTVQVDSLSDSGTGSLRQAIASASAGDDIVFAPGLAGTVYLDSPLAMDKALHVAGSGIVLDGRDTVRVLNVPGGAQVTLDGLTVQHGHAFAGGGISIAGSLVLNACTVRDNHADDNGGGISMSGGSFTLTASDVTNNDAIGQGGGIFIDAGTTTARIDSSTIAGNQAGSAGEGISHVSGTPLASCFSRITGNTLNSASNTLGGGSNTQDGPLTVSDSTISGNKAFFAGGIIVRRNSQPSTLVLERSLISGNTATSDGGGVFVFGGTLVGTNSTIAYNLAGTATGGGMSIQNTGAFSAFVALTHTTVAFNRSSSNGGGITLISGSLSLKNSLLGGNTAASNPDLQGSFTSHGYNLVQARGSSTGYVPSDLPNTANPALAALAFNGGPTSTLRPQAGSAAINAVVAANCSGIVEDQRRYRRPAGNCAIGAYD